MEVKFKGICIETGKWVFGGTHSPFEGVTQIIQRTKSNLSMMIPIIPETLCQFITTQLRSETELYEGDKVLVKGTKKVGTYETHIIRNIQGFSLNENKTYINNDKCLISVIEVIGNIHDK